jgi:hypothetical protein
MNALNAPTTREEIDLYITYGVTVTEQRAPITREEIDLYVIYGTTPLQQRIAKATA